MSEQPELQFTFLACADLKGIWEALAMPSDMWGATASENLAEAEKFSHQFAAHCQLLSRHPDMGLTRDELHHGVRSAPFLKYVIYYRVRADRLEVLRVLRANWGFAFPS
jgi:toxin ParE1/3/4